MEREFNRIRNINLGDCKLLKCMSDNEKLKLTEMIVDMFDKFRNEVVDSVVKFMDNTKADEQFCDDVDEFVHVAIL